MPSIMISYRRADAKAVAGRIYDRLASQYGDANVFMDVDHIPLGIDYRTHIKSVLAKSDVLLAVIGPAWLGPQPDGRHRLDEPADPVRVEIETALAEHVRIIPLLVDDTPMPDETALPASLKDFAFLNAAPVDSGRDFRAHMGRLIGSLDEILKAKADAAAPTPVATAAPTRKRYGAVAAGGLGIVAAGAAALYAWSVLGPNSAARAPASTHNAPPARIEATVAVTSGAAPAPAGTAEKAPPAAALAEASLKPVAASLGRVFKVPSTGVSDGILNMREGPGTQHRLVVSIPAGQSGVTLAGECRMPDDGGKKPWCKARWLRYEGWLSTCCVVDAATGAAPKIDLAAGILVD